MTGKFRKEYDSLGEVLIPSDKLWGPQTQRSLEQFSTGNELIPREMIEAYAIIKKSCALTNFKFELLDEPKKDLIVRVCDEILSGRHLEQFPLHVWMTGSGTHFNMNVNEVISNRCSQLTKNALGSKKPLHPNDHVNLSQSSNDTFPSAMHISTIKVLQDRLIPSVADLRNSLNEKAEEWKDIVKIGRTHMQDAVPITLGQEFSGYAGLLDDNLNRLKTNMSELYYLALGGTALGTGINAPDGFDKKAAFEIAKITSLPFKTAPNKFKVQGSHDALVMVSGTLKTLATSLYKISNDIRILSCGPRCGIHELDIPANEPGSSIMPGKINPSQCEALSMIAIQVISNDVAVTMGGGGGYLEMNVYKPLLIYNILQSINLLADGCNNFRKYLIEDMNPNLKQIKLFLEQSLMLVTALSPVIGYDKASKVAHHALNNDSTLKEAVLELEYLSKDEFDYLVNPKAMVHPTPKKID
ncbi:MAG: class II fumarate hydratase [Euryarchaeota archaeon]|nr:class II fumarate hydratase [Euryarchaeota archaeon]MBU4608704.1 class II fumarate hydratase [Euryarchaeota archaeon]MBV1754942.1 class II fumarate hydratase [Methanobacterium sp.]